MTGAHTPGPWVIENGWLQNERGPYADGQYLSVCMSATRLADGLLIAAAPNMLAALRTASWLLADISPDGLVKKQIDEVIERACPTPLPSGSIER